MLCHFNQIYLHEIYLDLSSDLVLNIAITPVNESYASFLIFDKFQYLSILFKINHFNEES